MFTLSTSSEAQLDGTVKEEATVFDGEIPIVTISKAGSVVTVTQPTQEPLETIDEAVVLKKKNL